MTRSWSTFLAPAYVLTSRMNTTSENASTTFDVSPMPNQRMKSGAKATRGRLLSAVTKGSSTRASSSNRARRKPATMPTAAPRTKPRNAS